MNPPRNTLVRWTGNRTGSVPAVRSEPRAEAGEPGFGALTPERARVLLLVAARPATFALTLIIALVLITLLASGSGMAGASGAMAASWLAAHQVPLVIGKTTLGLLPLLPTALLLWLAFRECAHAVRADSTRADIGWVVGAAVGGPLVVTAVCSAVAEDASAVVALQPPNTLVAFAWVGGLHLLAAGAGIATTMRGRLLALAPVPDWALAGAVGAWRTMLRLLACAAAVTVVSLLAHWSVIGETYDGAGNAWGVIGLTLLSLAYLPNVVVGSLGVLMGATVGFGDASVGLFSVVGGPVPALPVVAAVPTGPAAVWWAALLVIPAAVGVLGGVDAARTSDDRITAPWATLTSAGIATVVLVLLAALAGGELGEFGRVGVHLPIFAVACVGWLAVAGYVGLVCARWFLVPAGTAYTGAGDYDDDRYAGDRYDDEHYGYDDYDDHYADDDYDDVRAHDDHYDDDLRADDDHHNYDDRYDEDDALDAELVDDEPAVTASPPRAQEADIVDAEVVESDQEPDPAPGRR
ncbi:hypothetical protein IU433_08545 [Nocardia puris]|uniref:cell division protein PerM n=1 Tax=Nocardia puris TaxID=208602 RepID=UPI0018960807|nr:DUF6350 family protein [Nocardia puris]MBF6364157.1 hypothetical protein [Nocardia puris]MBF6459086.1 hypothetical protein [Nocardia puris]